MVMGVIMPTLLFVTDANVCIGVDARDDHGHHTNNLAPHFFWINCVVSLVRMQMRHTCKSVCMHCPHTAQGACMPAEWPQCGKLPLRFVSLLVAAVHCAGPRMRCHLPVTTPPPLYKHASHVVLTAQRRMHAAASGAIRHLDLHIRCLGALIP